MAKWTREVIVRSILSRESQGLPLGLSRSDGVSAALYLAGKRIFGSWPNALRAAGVSVNKAQNHDRWPPGKILAIIRSLARRRSPMRAEELQERYGYLVPAARRCFGSWSKAVIAAGVDPMRLMRAAPWTRDRIIESILMRALKNEPLGSRTVRPRTLADAGAKAFGSWAMALSAAGLDPKLYVVRVTDCRGKSETTSPDPAGAAGRSSRRGSRRWTDAEVIEAILRRLRENRTMNAKSIYREDRPLYGAATRRHRNWSNALTAAGLNPEEFKKRSSRRDSGVPGSVPPAGDPNESNFL